MGLVYFLQSAFRFLARLRDLFIALLALRPHWMQLIHTDISSNT